MFLALLLSLHATAAAPSVEAGAEHLRLSQDMASLAGRDAWVGVERTYRRIVELGVDPTWDDLLRGAHAASALGDVATARTRLEEANALREDREVIEWMWSIDESFGPVVLRGESGTDTLEVGHMPFHPHQARAIAYASDRLLETGAYEGLLPVGRYVFEGRSFQVAPFTTDPVVVAMAPPDKSRRR